MDYFIVSVIITVCIFLVLREFWCWYWKINESNDLKRSILAELKRVGKLEAISLDQTENSDCQKDDINEMLEKTDVNDDANHLVLTLIVIIVGYIIFIVAG